MKVFVRVAQRNGFAAAARDLRMSAAAVTKHVAALESRIGARLFDRTTRRVGLTEAGRIYLERCLECLQAVDDADASIGENEQRLKGVLRIAAPVDMPSPLPSIIGRFMRTHPEVVVELRLSNRPVDLVEEGIDVALRVAPALDGNYVARQLALVRLVAFATPAYLQKSGRPRKPEDLSRHRGLVFLEPRPRDEWVFERGGRSKRVKLRAALMSNDGEALRAMALADVGVCIAPSFLVAGDLTAGTLEALLPDWAVLPPLRLFAIYPHRRFLSSKVRALVEALRDGYGDGTADPWLPASVAAQK
jgi:DNA-binding transcriptional LysR family regulator